MQLMFYKLLFICVINASLMRYIKYLQVLIDFLTKQYLKKFLKLILKVITIKINLRFLVWKELIF